MGVRSDRSKVRNNLLRALSFTGTGFTTVQMSVETPAENRVYRRDKDALVFAFVTHIHPGPLRDSKDVWRVLVLQFPAILVYYCV